MANKEIIIVDESGDAGLSDKEGTSKYITFGVVFFETLEAAKEADQRIEILKKDMGITDEFKFSKLSKNKREKFLKNIIKSDFYFFYVTIDKLAVKDDSDFDDGTFYRYACSLGFLLAKPYMNNAIVIVDGSGSKEFRNNFQRYIKNQMDGKISKFKIQDSKKNNLVQLADMITGATAKRTSHKEDKDFYFNLIKVRCVDYKYYPDELLSDLRQNKTAL
jgi:hypothetical protein